MLNPEREMGALEAILCLVLLDPLPGSIPTQREADPILVPQYGLFPLSYSAMAVESFTATAPFVQIGRFFLSAGESQASCGGAHPKAFPSPWLLPGLGP
jgi:hypothetical protein